MFNLQSVFKEISLLRFNAYLAVWLAVALNFMFYKQIQLLTPYQGFKAYAFIAATVLVILALYNLVFQIIQWRPIAKCVAAILILVGGMSAYFVNSLGVAITPDQIQNMMQTDGNEVRDLLSWHLVIWVGMMVVLPLVILFKVKIRHDSFKTVLLHKLLGSAISVVMIASLLFVFFVDYASIFREHRDLKGMISPQNAISSTLSYYKKNRPQQYLPLVKYGEDAHLVEQVGQKELPKLMVLVVGETARAESFSLNGYAKKTNPELEKLNVINFSQVSSCGTATAVSVPCMFSGMTRENYDAQLAKHREGLLDLAQRAGYKVTWIDNNSGCKGVCDRVEQFKIPEPIQKKWCSADGECADEILVDSFKAYIASIATDDKTPRLIVLHQMGSHGPAYYKRSQVGFQPFKPMCETNAIQGCSPEQLKNSYDNSIVYTDHILSQLIGVLKQNQSFETGFWYLSDHGESTGEHGLYLHGSPYAIAPSQQTHVPMLMWFSETWKKQNPQQMTCLAQQKSQELSQDHLFPSLLSLLEVKSEVIDSKNNMLEQCTSTKARA
ncbi:lipid A phosphoethanolamine transferase [Acinetobacter johnsonii]|jgi:lipid A ethanolaminephosphotransferase|uniref:Lipid A phosphoethanolamine transferase n=1 Tax=Acinetobacter johnsonii TaxID=40214 RepID=A0A3S9AIE4_ACIJO|nr:phosphoethanolamine--lipid A transferase [Acinetobacter johnsonii]AZN63378.1 lipid A phosphoethanolamine transferase [Acinetobacter johnsonii]MDN5625804.1 phosphoethanolamine--lipid A transferase [Acinetobacter sp.]